MLLPLWEGAASTDGSTTGTPLTGTWVSRSEGQTPKLLGLRHYWIQSKSKHSIY